MGPQRRTGTEGLGGSVRCPKETRRAAVSAARPAAPCGEPRRFVPRRKGRDGPRGSGNGMGGLMIAQRRSKSAPDRSDPRGSAVTPKWGFGSIGAHWGPLGALGPFGGIKAHWGPLEALGPFGSIWARWGFGGIGALWGLWGHWGALGVLRPIGALWGHWGSFPFWCRFSLVAPWALWLRGSVPFGGVFTPHPPVLQDVPDAVQLFLVGAALAACKPHLGRFGGS